MKEFIVLSILIGGSAIVFLVKWLGLRFLRLRRSHKILWQNAFQSKDFARIDQLLADICDAFMISRKHRFKLKPNDKLKMIYRNTACLLDSMEYEHLLLALEKHFNVTEGEFMAMLKQEPTIGDLVRRVAQPINKETAPNKALQATRLPGRQARA